MAEAYLFTKLFSPNTFYSANSPNINPTKHSRYTVANILIAEFIHSLSKFCQNNINLAICQT